MRVPEELQRQETYARGGSKSGRLTYPCWSLYEDEDASWALQAPSVRRISIQFMLGTYASGCRYMQSSSAT